MPTLLNRIGPIPAPRPDWSREVQMGYEFKTSIIEAQDGTEQREALRTTARIEVSFATLLTEAAMHRMQADLTKDQEQLFVLPIRWRQVDVAGQASAALTVAELPFWAVAGAKVVLTDEATEEAAEIASVAAGTITLTAAPALGSLTRVFHAYSARMSDSLTMNSPIDTIWRGEVEFSVDPGSDPQAAPTLALPQFDTEDLFLDIPNWSREPRTEIVSLRRELDSGRGLTLTDSRLTYNRQTLRLGFTKMSATAVENLIAFFLHQKGKRGSFFAPTHRHDVTPAATILAGSTGFTVAGTDFLLAYENHPVYNVLIANGQANRIASMADIGGNTVLVMTDPWANDITSSTKVSWCPLWRFATDRLEVNWLTSQVAEIEVSLTTLANGGADGP